MAFPLTGTARSTTNTVRGGDSFPTRQFVLTNRFWLQKKSNFNLNPLVRSISGPVYRCDASVGMPCYSRTMQRHWAGLGGTTYLPSFPTLPTHTSYPWAF